MAIDSNKNANITDYAIMQTEFSCTCAISLKPEVEGNPILFSGS